ncbi:polysaccharide biosynthesis/export family protein [Crateriforma conspicua]|uniref:Polysaccharide biosynthesis/export protein n=1 Tax=Crateriforma conspicua TaxID=2527996 RepID=A0A5C6FQ49_9PLAN|nr:polysaccharide biosynthesis/export family protein [Crateriforma conspicua]TWU63414.1 Polysaccharide biosynthesis/export protein [Crateriforma conspicua]
MTQHRAARPITAPIATLALAVAMLGGLMHGDCAWSQTLLPPNPSVSGQRSMPTMRLPAGNEFGKHAGPIGEVGLSHHRPAPYAVAAMPMVAPSTCASCAGVGCRVCVDRDGREGFDQFAHHQGICTDQCAQSQCWQCPYTSPFDLYRQGGYAGPSRTPHVYQYRLRPGDVIQLTYLLSDHQTATEYRLSVGDELLIESEADEALTRGTLENGIEIQPDGTITLRFIGTVHAAGQTIDQLRESLNDKYSKLYADPAIDVTPVSTATASKRIRDAISGTGGFTAQFVNQTVTPQGEIRLPGIGSVQAQGLTLEELKREINLRYASSVGGIEVEPALQQQAPHYIYVLGEAVTPGRFTIDQPTTVLGAIAMAGGHVPGANLRQIVIFRRGENWELISTMLDLRGAILGKSALPHDEIWVQDGDVIILPSMPIRLFDNFVRLVFTEGIYGIVPFQGFSIDLDDSN